MEKNIREELIKKLKKVDFCAAPIFMTIDMGIEYAYITAEGVGTSFGRIGEWPAYQLNKIDNEKWLLIKNKIRNNCLDESDFNGTEIEIILNNIHEIYGDMYDEYYENMTETFYDLINLPEVLSEQIYCLWDIRAWGEKPRFFVRKSEFLEVFKDEYCDDICPWEELEDEQLEEWNVRIKEDFAKFPFNEI